MNKSDLVNLIAEKFGLSKRASEEIIDAIFSEIIETLTEGKEVKLTGFGTFSVRSRAERKGINPQDGKPIVIPSGKTLLFKPSKILKDKINK